MTIKLSYCQLYEMLANSLDLDYVIVGAVSNNRLHALQRLDSQTL